MFLGTYTPRLDDKGRLFLPAKLRDELDRRVVITKGQEHCLYVVPPEEFARMAAPATSAPVTDRDARTFARLLASGASFEEVDAQGRLSVPPLLREYAGLGRDVTVIGALQRIEIWDSAAWQAFLAQEEAGYAELDHKADA